MFIPTRSVQAVIDAPEDIAVGRTMILTAAKSVYPEVPDTTVSYTWFVQGMSDPISRAVDAIYTPEQPGKITFRLIISLERNGASIAESTVTHQVVAYRRKMTLITESSVPDDRLEALTQTASGAGIYVRTITLPDTATSQQNYDASVAFLNQNDAALDNSETIILWSNGISLLQALMQAVRNDQDRLAEVQDQAIVLIGDGNLRTLGRAANGPFSVLRPNQIVLTRPEAVPPLLLSNSVAAFVSLLEERGVEHLVLDATSVGVRPWNVLSWLVNSMLVRGVSSQAIVLLLMLPVIATILAFLKQVVGIVTFGLFTPSIVALSFLALGWWVGLLFLIFILATGYLTRAIMQRWRLLFIPKVAVILSVVSITLLILLGIGAAFNIILSRDSIFILLILSTLGESFLTAKTEQGLQGAIFSVGQTVLAALICVMIVQWTAFQSVVLAYPELILLTILMNFLLGKWTGLRLIEYFRFREVFRHLYEE